MYGFGVLRGLWIVFRHFAETYVDDLRWRGRRYYNPEALKVRQGAKGRGAFTVQYPEERLTPPEEFRYLPFLVYEDNPGGADSTATTRDYRCTACGTCAKACPPQCIWIERASDPVTHKPVAKAKEFVIDIDNCMSCGFCAEYCPFDAIKMDHDFEVALYTRGDTHLWNMERLGKPVSHYASIRPKDYARDMAERAAKEAKKAAKQA
jgi:NADH-quinone oxidoreductase subunit I